MQRRNAARFGTAFTVSIEATEGITTGISAADRAHTVRTAIDPESVAADIATPGHIFPIVARDGGVLARAGELGLAEGQSCDKLPVLPGEGVALRGVGVVCASALPAQSLVFES